VGTQPTKLRAAVEKSWPPLAQGEDKMWFRHRRVSEPFWCYWVRDCIGRDIGDTHILSGRQVGSRQILAATLLRGPRHQRRKDHRNENERRRISHQMTALGGIVQGLNTHNRPVNHARPHGEPDEALVSKSLEARIKNTPKVAYTPMIIIR
jgi:hypothetical protein